MSKTKSQQQILRNLLTKAKSTSSNSSHRSVDEASIALGKQIAKVFISLYIDSKGDKEKGEWADVGDEFFRMLQLQLSFSIGYGFFDGLANEEHWSGVSFDVVEEFIHWWVQCIWVYDRESSFSSDDILVFCVKGFIKLVSQVSADPMFILDGNADRLYLASAHQKCKSKTRILFIRECISMATESKLTNGSAFLSPLFHEVVSGSNMSSDALTVEARAFTAYLFHNLRMILMSSHIDGALLWIKWIVKAMDDWFFSIHSSKHDENYHETMVIFIDTLNDLSEILMLLIRQSRNLHLAEEADSLVSNFVQSSCDMIIPKLCKHRMSHLLRQFAKSICIITSMKSSQLSESCILNLLICSLVVIEEYDALLLLEIVNSAIKEMKNVLSVKVLRTIFVVGSIHRNPVGDFMLDFADKYLSNVNSEVMSAEGDEVICAMINSKRWETILKPLPTNRRKTLIETLSPNVAPVSARNFDEFSQCEALLLGASIILSQSSSQRSEGFYFLRCILSEYPNLGRRCLNVCTHLIQLWTHKNQARNLASVFEFLCDTVARDAICAGGIWSLLASITEKSCPEKMKCMVIRMYPSICKSNKRMYGRIINALGSFSEYSNSMIRTTTSITICEMAKTDVIRDVSDIIGWIQGFLSDEEPLVTMHAILSLHHLILHGYLDFSVVVKVLKKKLVAVDDVSALIKLPVVVLEALIQLLGDASQERTIDSDSDDHEYESSQVVISVHEQAAVQGLLGLAHYFVKDISFRNQNDFDESSLNILIEETFTSLSNYSIPFLGIDFDMIRGDIQIDSAQPYLDLQKILMSGFENLKVDCADDVHKSPIISVIKKLCAFEEEALGPGTWVPISSFQKQRVSVADVREGMPAAREGTMINFLIMKLRDDSVQIPRVALLLECLQDLSLPASFIPLLKHHILQDDMKDDKLSVIRTIISQLKIERRAASERRDYIRLASDIFQLPSDLFWKKIRNEGGSQFICGIPTVFAHLSTDAMKEALPLIWEHTKFTKTTENIMNLIVALNIIMDTSTSSPAMIRFIQNFLEKIEEELSYLPYHDQLEMKLHLMQNENRQIDILSEMNVLSFSGYYVLK